MNEIKVGIFTFLLLCLPSVVSAKIKVGAMPFTNISGDTTIDYLRTELPKEILLEIAKDLNIEPIGQAEIEKAIVEAGLPENTLPIKIAKAVGDKLGADIIVFGDFQKFKESLRVGAYVCDIKNERILDTVKLVSPISELFSLIDKVAKKTANVVRRLSSPISTSPTIPENKKSVSTKKSDLKKKKKVTKPPVKRTSVSRAKIEDEATYRLLMNQITKEGMHAIDYYNKGVSLSDGSDLEISYYLKAIELDPTLADAYYNLGVIYANRGNTDTAIMYFEQFLKYSTNEERKVEVVKFITQLKGQKAHEPVQTTTTATGKYNRKMAEKWYNEGVKLSDNSDEEIKYYMWAIQADPTFDRPHYNLATIYYQRGMFKEAIKEYEEYLKYTHDPPDEKERVKKIVEYLKTMVNK